MKFGNFILPAVALLIAVILLGKQRNDMSVIRSANAELRQRIPAQIARCEAWNTQPTRRTVASILSRLELPVFNQFKANPETFVARASSLIKEQKATMIIEHLAQVQRLAGEQPHDHRGIQ